MIRPQRSPSLRRRWPTYVPIIVGVLVVALAPAAGLGTRAAATTSTFVVSPSGNDSNSGTAQAPFRTLQRALKSARAGVTVQLRKGTYTGPFTVDGVSGTANARITIEPAGDGPVILTAKLASVTCDRSQPAPRTLNLNGGSDYWTVRGLQIRGGIGIKGIGWQSAFSWLKSRVAAGDWQSRRAVPGHGKDPDASAIADVPSYLAGKTGKPTNSADGISLTDNLITGRGIWTVLAQHGSATRNRISDIDCGTGPAAWFNTFSDGWTVDHNTVSRIATSAYKHYMQEGIRLGSASSYGRVSDNVVSDIGGEGRAFSTDVDASFNTFSHNTAKNVFIGYNEEMSGWENTWSSNSATEFDKYGYSVRMKDSSLTKPSWNSTSYRAIYRCNTADHGPTALGVGGAMQAEFENNGFSTVYLSANVRSYWKSQGDTYNGSASPPGKSPPIVRSGCDAAGVTQG